MNETEQRYIRAFNLRKIGYAYRVIGERLGDVSANRAMNLVRKGERLIRRLNLEHSMSKDLDEKSRNVLRRHFKDEEFLTRKDAGEVIAKTGYEELIKQKNAGHETMVLIAQALKKHKLIESVEDWVGPGIIKRCSHCGAVKRP